MLFFTVERPARFPQAMINGQEVRADKPTAAASAPAWGASESWEKKETSWDGWQDGGQSSWQGPAASSWGDNSTAQQAAPTVTRREAPVSTTLIMIGTGGELPGDTDEHSVRGMISEEILSVKVSFPTTRRFENVLLLDTYILYYDHVDPHPSCQVPLTRKGRKSRGFAFVELGSRESAERAVKV